MSNAWMLPINEDELITDPGVIDSLNFLHKNDTEEHILHLHKRVTYDGTLRNECR